MSVVPALSHAQAEEKMPARKLLRIYWFSCLVTLVIFAGVGVSTGSLANVWTVMVLTGLEVTFSFDNAVVNAKVLKHMSPFWQKIFLTVGILIAVFVVRFALPILIVMLTAGMGFGDVISMALNQPELYATELEKAGPSIEAFGGMFLLMIALSYFLDHEKDVHWIAPLERRLSPTRKIDNLVVFLMLMLTAVIYFTVDAEVQTEVLLAAVMGIALHIGLGLFDALFKKEDDEDDDENPTGASNIKTKVGMAAFASFLYLEVLDASFSFDGVIGAFAITSSVLLIMAGLGAGAMWVRSITVHLVRAGTLSKYQYMEHGAHWAIGFLGGVMLVKLYHVEPPEWAVGSLGLVFIALAVGTSILEKRREERELQAIANGTL